VPEAPGEFARIAAIVASLPPGEGVVVGPGDDAAVLRPREGRDLVVTTDAFVEGRHFRLDLLGPEETGVRLAAANLSDLAAMAAEPRWAVVSLVVPPVWEAETARRLEASLARALAADGVTIVGGNLASGEGAMSATVTLLGEVERGRAWTRTGARRGDALAVTGYPGSAAAFLALALWGNPPDRARVPEAVASRVLAPPSRVSLARELAALGAVHAAVDVSDGLAADLAHLCAASGVGARLDEAALPADEALRAAARALSASAGQERGPLPAGESGVLTHLQLGPGDDYELLLAVDPDRWAACEAVAAARGVAMTRIGTFVSGGSLELTTRSGEVRRLVARGWDHFAG